MKIDVSDAVKALIPEEKLMAMMNAFSKIDLDQDGKIELDEYLNFVLAKEKARVIRVFAAADTDKDSCIDFEEFVATIEPNYWILKRFRELDLDQNGLLSLEEALEIAEQLELPLNTNQTQLIMSSVDRDGDGQITYYEYLGAIAHIGFQ